MKCAIAAMLIAVLEARASADSSAEVLYTQGKAAYDAAAYATAIDKWTEAYSLSGAPGLLFNLAQAYRLNGDCIHALSSYRRFVEADAKSEQRSLADEFIAELQPACSATSSTPHVDRPNAEPGRTLRAAGLALGGGGVVVLVAGLAVGHHASTLGDEVSHACATSCVWDEQRSKDSAGRRDAAIGYVLDGVGVAAIAGGAIMYYLGGRRNAVMIEPRPRDGGVVVTWSGAW
jgi:tetratricopeptide (TPR) repeat protein